MNQFSIIEFEKDRYLISGILNKEQLKALHDELIEPKSRSWRGQYQEFAKSFVRAYKEIYE